MKINIAAKASLYAAAVIWGSSFFILKGALDVLPMAFVLAVRFTIAGVLLLAFSRNISKKISKEYVLHSFYLAINLYFGYFVQTYGLKTTTPAKNAFLTASYCVFVPFLLWVVNRKRPNKYNISAAFMCLIGIGLVTLEGSLQIAPGDALSLLSGIFYAIQIVQLGMFSPGKDPILFTGLEMAFIAVFFWITAVFTGTASTHIPAGMVWPLVYMGVFCTAGAMILQNFGQKYTNPSTAAIIMTLEAVFGVLFSMLFYSERVTAKLAVGFAVIFAAIALSQKSPPELENTMEVPDEGDTAL